MSSKKSETYKKFPKVHAKKIKYTELSPSCGVFVSNKKAQGFVEALNGDVLVKLAVCIEKNESINLEQTINLYNIEMEKLSPSKKIRGVLGTKAPSSSCYPHYFKNKFPGDKYFTDSYLALASVFNLNPLASQSDSLSDLLNQEFEFDDVENNACEKEFSYINIKDVLKSKGNAINAPKREDIGIFNRKLFESHSKELAILNQERLFVNPGFVGLSFQKDEILSSDPVSLSVFDGQTRISKGDYILVLHRSKNNSLFCTIRNQADTFIYKAKKSAFCCGTSFNNKRVLNLLCLETLSLAAVEFVCEEAASFAFKLFFQKV